MRFQHKTHQIETLLRDLRLEGAPGLLLDLQPLLVELILLLLFNVVDSVLAARQTRRKLLLKNFLQR